MVGSNAKKETRYHSPLRQRQAAETRRIILEAALSLFGSNGWAATTLTAVAEEAGVSVDAVYSGFGTKSALLMEVVETALVGDDEDAPMADRPDFAVLGEGDLEERVRAGVRYTMATYQRSVPILQALREAGASDDVAQERSARFDRDRHELMSVGMTLMMDTAAPDEVTDAVWALVSPEVFVHLRDGRDWDWNRLEDFFVELTQFAIDRAR